MLSDYIVKSENHRYIFEAEDSLINKIYMFQFVNTYISNFVCIFYYQSFYQLQYNMCVVMVFMQVIWNGGEYLYLYFTTNAALKKVDRLFDDAIKEKLKKGKLTAIEIADLHVHRTIEQQCKMKAPPKTLVFFYNEAIIQMGYIALFAVALPLAPVFSLLTNLLEIKIKLATMTEYGKRAISQGSSGIGNWSSIMSFISFIAIPINLSILIYARSPSVEVGWGQNIESLDFEEESTMSQFLIKMNPERWTKYNILLLAVVLEHVIIGLKSAIAILIPDLPQSVIVAEVRRKDQIKAAQDEINAST